eukprot:COSAG06_NODE_19251_length_846_cov_1.544846_1_plen_113_part_01
MYSFSSISRRYKSAPPARGAYKALSTQPLSSRMFAPIGRSPPAAFLTAAPLAPSCGSQKPVLKCSVDSDGTNLFEAPPVMPWTKGPEARPLVTKKKKPSKPEAKARTVQCGTR